MGLGRNISVKMDDKGKWNIFGKGTNTSNEHNSSHFANLPTNFNLAKIDLVDIDQGVWQEFNNRFVIADKNVSLISGDAETVSIINDNYKDYDQEKLMLNWPFFVYTRTETNKILRTSPTYKQVVFAVPVKKSQGIVIEEFITEGPINYELIYEFKFITYFREEANDMEQQMNHYFRNKRNIIVVCNERFSIGPTNNQLCNLDMISRDEASQITMYVLTFKLKVWAWTRRGTDDMQKRERPNSYTFNFKIQDTNKNKLINLEQITIPNKTKPDELI